MNITAAREIQNTIRIKISELKATDVKDKDTIRRLRAQIIELEFDLFIGKISN